MGCIREISLEEIIKRKVRYCQNDTRAEMIQMNKGYVRGYRQILEDVNMEESNFISKYLKIVDELNSVFEETDYSEHRDFVDELSGYNNAMVDILALLDEKYLYEDAINLRDGEFPNDMKN